MAQERERLASRTPEVGQTQPVGLVSRIARRLTLLTSASTLALLLTPLVAYPADVDISGEDVVFPGAPWPDPWVIDGSLYVGRTARGSLTINGGLVSSEYGRIGGEWGNDATGEVRVIGPGAQWNVSRQLMLGLGSGPGTLTVQDGGSIGGDSSLDMFGAGGKVTVSGPGSTVNIRGMDLQAGELIIEDGGSLIARPGSINTVRDAKVTVTGQNSTLIAENGRWFIGATGTGELLVEKGGTVVAGEVFVSEGPGGYGTLRLESGGLLEAAQVSRKDLDATVIFDGGILRLTDHQSYLFERLTDVTVQGGGAVIDTNGYGVATATSFQGPGSLTKEGTGTLTLSGDNRNLLGGTIVKEGTLRIASFQSLAYAPLMINGGRLELIADTPYTVKSLSGEGGELRFSASNSSLRVEQDRTTSYAGAIGGSGGSITLAGAGTLALDGQISSGRLIVSDGGTLIVNGDNSYAGGTGVANATLIAGHDNAFGAYPITFAGSSTLTSNRDVRLENPIWLDSPFDTRLTIDSRYDMTLAGSIVEVFGPREPLRKTGSGTLTITSSNSYQSGTIIEGGRLVAADDMAFGTGPVTALSGSTLSSDREVTLANDLVLGTGAAMTLDASHDMTLSGDLSDDSGTGTMRKTGSGTLILTGGGSGFLGEIAVQEGALAVNNIFGGSVSATRGTLTGSGAIGGAVTIDTNSALEGASGRTLTMGSLSLGGTAKVALGAPNATPLFSILGDIFLDGRLVIDNGADFDFGTYALFGYDGSIGPGGGGLALASPPTGYSADSFSLTDEGGQIKLTVSASAADRFWAGGSGTWNAATLWKDDSGLLRTPFSGAIAVFGGKGGTVTVEGTQSFEAMRFEAGSYTLAKGAGGELAIDGATGGVRVNGSATATIAAPISGAGELAKAGSGTLVLTGANTYAGGTRLEGGVLSVSRDENLGADSGGLTFDGGALRTTAGFATSRDITLETTGGSIEVGGRHTLALSGTIGGTGGLSKTGRGTLALAGTNTYTGPTFVQAGTLTINGLLASPVTVASGAVLGGSGTVGGLTARSGATVAPGNSIGTLSVNGNVSFAPGATYEIEANSAGQSDRIMASGRATL